MSDQKNHINKVPWNTHEGGIVWTREVSVESEYILWMLWSSLDLTRPSVPVAYLHEGGAWVAMMLLNDE